MFSTGLIDLISLLIFNTIIFPGAPDPCASGSSPMCRQCDNKGHLSESFSGYEVCNWVIWMRQTCWLFDTDWSKEALLNVNKKMKPVPLGELNVNWWFWPRRGIVVAIPKQDERTGYSIKKIDVSKRSNKISNLWWNEWYLIEWVIFKETSIIVKKV